MLIERRELLQIVGESRVGFLGEVAFELAPEGRIYMYIFSIMPLYNYEQIMHCTIRRKVKRRLIDLDRPRRKTQGDKVREKQSMCGEQVGQAQGGWILDNNL